ncbi:MAG: BlaI/MecI/CopY family transcriptional regulator [Rikenellaceae bacterium]
MEIIKELTKVELEMMKILWQTDKAFLSDIVNAIPEPRPAYTTVSTVIRILVKKGYVAYKQYGKIHCYYPLITKEEYAFFAMNRMKSNFFGDSVSNMISFFAKKEKISDAEKAEIVELLNSQD